MQQLLTFCDSMQCTYLVPYRLRTPYNEPSYTDNEANKDMQLFNESPAGRSNSGVRLTDGLGFDDGCQLTGISLGDGKYLANLGMSEE